MKRQLVEAVAQESQSLDAMNTAASLNGGGYPILEGHVFVGPIGDFSNV